MKAAKIKKQILRFFLNIGTSGKFTGGRDFKTSEYLIRYALFNFLSIFGIIILVTFALWDIKTGLYSDAAVCLIMVAIGVVTFCIARTKVSYIVPTTVMMVFYQALCITVTWIGEAGGASFLFIYAYPLAAIMLLGMRLGVFLSLTLLATVSVEMFIPGASRFSYHADMAARMLASYLLVFAVMIVVETTRKAKDQFIEQQGRRIQDLRERAEAANRTKSVFLASMSHEIRTPMNAITGMVELLLRGELSEEGRNCARDIKRASSNLLSIINDLLDFSKIEAGRLDIISARYFLSSLVNDTISIIRVRLMEKPIRFFTNIDCHIPNCLIGDETRVRQICLNLLSNAVKYTERGAVSVKITEDGPREGNRVRLRVEVADTGIGIKPEEQDRLFGEFIQVDTKKNRSVEGAGLGLVITKRLCTLMGGDITVTSEYGKGSVFTAFISQEIGGEAPFAAVREAEQKKVLVYEGRKVYADSICWSLDNMGVAHRVVSDQETFAQAVEEEPWFFVFSGYGLYKRIRPIMDRPENAFPENKKPPLALMVEWGVEAYLPGVRFVSLPVQSLSIADVLNGLSDQTGYHEGLEDFAGTRFIAPGARILVVDDITTNLKVAEGLLSPYKTMVDTCLSGIDAVELVKRRHYDLIFMDHMMPEMDGIEAATLIRSWEAEQGEGHKRLPIIALTANAVSGMREVFLENDFNDLLTKPIDISRLDEIMGTWIPRSKQKRPERRYEETGCKHKIPADGKVPVIAGIEVEKGITMTGGTLTGYRQVLALFCKDAEARLPLLQNAPDEAGLPLFTTQVHALKSAAVSIGTAALSAEAARLEAAGKAGDLAFIGDALPNFAEDLVTMVRNIRGAIETVPGGSPSEAFPPDLPFSLLEELLEALKVQNVGTIERILENLEGTALDAKIREILDRISSEVLMAEFKKAAALVEMLLGTENS